MGDAAASTDGAENADLAGDGLAGLPDDVVRSIDRELYDELLGIAHLQLRRDPFAELSTSSVAHAAWMKLATHPPDGVNSPRHLLFIWSLAVKQVLTDHARHRRALRRQRVDVTEDPQVQDSDTAADVLVEVDDLLARLWRTSPRMAQVVVLKFYGRYTDVEIAGELGISERTARRDWSEAQTLARRLDA